MLSRDGNILYIIEFPQVSMKLEPRWVHVRMGHLQRIEPENISHQKPVWKFDGSISFRWRDIQKTMCMQCIAIIENFFKVFSFRRREKNWGPDF